MLSVSGGRERESRGGARNGNPATTTRWTQAHTHSTQAHNQDENSATKAASKTTKDNEKPEAGATPETQDSPLIDQNDAAVKKLIKVAKKRGLTSPT
ncbi:MAG: hypothetical protein HC767_01440, partial [Akkermansiaceae bacterium]|nr:hypothetical protein [Akkermansiaceae bacterium]